MKPLRSCTALLATALPTLALAHPGHADDSTLSSALRHVFTPDAAHFGGMLALALLGAVALSRIATAARKRKARPTAGAPRSRI